MRQQPNGSRRSASTPFPLRIVKQNIPIALFLLLAMVGMIAVYSLFSPYSEIINVVSASDLEIDPEGLDPDSPSALISKPRQIRPAVQRRPQSPGPIRIGIIAGHRGSDSGTSCSDGLTEVQITNSLAERVAVSLSEADVPAETLDEFDSKLDGYSATALVSIHVDSCDYINDLATGYKISGSSFTNSEGLSICMQRVYGEMTQLPYHPNSITPHMANYHAFRAIGTGTPAIIIEVGFLYLDREMLTVNSDRVVDAITKGVLCFLEQES